MPKWKANDCVPLEGAYTGTTFHKVIPGRYIKAGRQGQRRYGEIDINKTEGLPPNPDMVRTKLSNLCTVLCNNLLL